MYNKCLLSFFVFLAFASATSAQDAVSDGTKTLGTIIRSQLDGGGVISDETPAIAADVMPENAVIDPDFLSGDITAYDDYTKVVIRILDKVTADTRTFDLNVGKTVAFGSLRIRPTTCKKAPPIEEPESVSFLQIWEKTPEANDEWVFSGWMFASSPSLSAMEHPVYDVWVIDCKD